MRKLLMFTTIIVTFFLISCNDNENKKNEDSEVLVIPNYLEKIDSVKAYAMIKHYNDAKVPKNDSTIIRQVYLDKELLRFFGVHSIMNNKSRLKILIAATLDDLNLPENLRNFPTVVYQIQEKKNNQPDKFDYYTIKSGSLLSAALAASDLLCPPPTGNCLSQIQD